MRRTAARSLVLVFSTGFAFSAFLPTSERAHARGFSFVARSFDVSCTREMVDTERAHTSTSQRSEPREADSAMRTEQYVPKFIGPAINLALLMRHHEGRSTLRHFTTLA
jgi:hypothetical protein